MKLLSFLNYDPQESSPQYLEDLATGYWFSEVFFTAVDLDIFTLLDPEGMTASQIAGVLDCHCQGVKRFLEALRALGLLNCDGHVFYNTKISAQYLVKGKKNYQGNSILWRKYLSSSWRDLAKCLKAGTRVSFPPSQEEPWELNIRIRRYISAMDNVARTKIQEILAIFQDMWLEGEILDVGAGSGTVAAGFLERFSSMKATLMDLPAVLEYARELMAERGLGYRVTTCPADILKPWPIGKRLFGLVILSNIIHAYGEKEVIRILARARDCLGPDGFLVIHDFFMEHRPEKAALFDLNMFINTYNGKVFAGKWVEEYLKSLGLCVTGLIPLATDTAVIIASQNENALARLSLDSTARLISRIKALGFRNVYPLSVKDIHVVDWADVRCRFGCKLYGKHHCPPNSPPPQKTRELLGDYVNALLLEGEPPARTFQQRVLQAEREAFKVNFYKAFAYWAGPCAICSTCTTDGVCRNTRDTRPSMEGAGIDVFETARRAGITLRTLEKKDDFIKYLALLLLE
ncbi:MAG: methyltransferase domain-containing protein [Desulfobacteraceae bacterium]|nr:MAG: methyltransferase domain-containing protein [Desulfobacteraceae bacterium]